MCPEAQEKVGIVQNLISPSKMDSTSNSTPAFWFYLESHGAWSYGTPSYIHMCPLATVLTDTRIVVENTMEHGSQEQVVPYFTNSVMDTHWMDSENMPPMGSSSPIDHHSQDYLPVQYPLETQPVADEYILTAEQNFDGITPKIDPKAQTSKQPRIQKKSKTVKKEQVEDSQEVQPIVQSILPASEVEVEIDPETKRKMKRAEKERNRYHSMTIEARQAMQKRRYAARKQRQAEKN